MPAGRILWVDPVGGAAGDMLCAALLDAGGDIDRLREDLLALPVRGYRLERRDAMRGVFRASWFGVHADPTSLDQAPPRFRRGPVATGLAPVAAAAAAAAHAHDHGHNHGHSHSHDHDHADEWAGQPDRSWATIRLMIEGADLPERAQQRALRAFARLADAEARVHGTSVDDVIFHEVGAVDSIVDVVGCCLLLEQLDVDRIVCGPLPIASGMIQTAHGPTPLPAPATAALLVGWPTRVGRPGREELTPTGAALLTALAEPGEPPPMVVRRIGCGAGTRNPPDHPNVLRVVLGDSIAPSSPTEVVVLAAQMDDFSGEHLPPLMEAVLAAGALDVWATPVLMKKGRSGLLVEALCDPGLVGAVEGALMMHGSTFGVRRTSASRTVLERRHQVVTTPYGPVRIKLGSQAGEILHAAPEFQDVLDAARRNGVPVPQVHDVAIAAWHQDHKRGGA
jgi:pyridinium-3,5-bisthiocarboxylic acid mononucleotide nickel chelatase